MKVKQKKRNFSFLSLTSKFIFKETEATITSKEIKEKKQKWQKKVCRIIDIAKREHKRKKEKCMSYKDYTEKELYLL